MNHDYGDIRSRISEPPKWWDELAVPRYCEFAPREVADIYANEAALVEIACSGCGERFLVAFAQSHPFDIRTGQRIPSLADEIRSRAIHYGDPPNNGCCPAGATMNCDDLRVVEFWKRDRFDWQRCPELERDLTAAATLPEGDRHER